VFLLANAEVALKLCAVVSEAKSGTDVTPPWQRWLMRFLGVVVAANLVWLAVMVGLRAKFPWDLFMWPESPFMTNMLKLDHGQPIFTSPADGNSFVYSPGLEYLTFAILKPLGLHLDIRYCRLVNVAVGLLAGIVAGFALHRAVKMVAPDNCFPRLAWLGGGVAVLVIFRNFTADVTHPDNLVMLHTAGVFLLTLWAWREKRFGIAVLAMLFAGWGVFAKQILAVAFLGPAVVFARFNPWGWRKWFVLVGLGALSAVSALAVMAWQASARFYLLELLPSQGIHLTRFYWMVIDLFSADRAILFFLGLIAAGLLWRSGQTGRDYVQFCAAIGIFSVCPNVASYVKTMGIWNNLVIFQLWLVLLVWPALAVWFRRAANRPGAGADEGRLLDWTIATSLVLFAGLLFPPKTPADPAMYAACNEIQKMVDADIQTGRKVLIGHGMMYLLRAGSKEVPLDRTNSILELKAAGHENLSQFPDRIRQRYYDRLYLTVEHWYPPEFIAEIDKHYRVQTIVKQPPCSNHLETGRYTPLIGDCRIMIPRQP
jgi:hypothetical protein